MFSHILCATDLSPRSDEALRVAEHVVRHGPCPVLVIPYIVE